MHNNSPYTLAVRTRKPWISQCVVRGIRAVCRLPAVLAQPQIPGVGGGVGRNVIV